MKTEYLTDYSPALGRDMECMVYGHAGRPVLYIPCQDGRFFDFGDFHMDRIRPDYRLFGGHHRQGDLVGQDRGALLAGAAA